MSLDCTQVYVVPAILSLCQVSLLYCPVIEERNGVWLWNKPQQYSSRDTTTSILHLVAPLFRENSCPTSSESLLMSKYNHLQNLRILENHTIARNRAVWEFYVICESDLQLKLAGSSSVTHAFERHSALTHAGQATVLFALGEFQDGYNKIDLVHSFLVYSDSTFLIMATS